MQAHLTVNLLQHDWEQEISGGHVGLPLVHHWGKLVEANLPGGQRWNRAHLEKCKYDRKLQNDIVPVGPCAENKNI